MRFIQNITFTGDNLTKLKSVIKYSYTAIFSTDTSSEDENFVLTKLAEYGVNTDICKIKISQYRDNIQDCIEDDSLLTPEMYPYLKKHYVKERPAGTNYAFGVIFLPKPTTYIESEFKECQIDYIFFSIVQTTISMDAISLNDSIFDEDSNYTLSITSSMLKDLSDVVSGREPFSNLVNFGESDCFLISQSLENDYVNIYTNFISRNPYSDSPLYNSRLSLITQDDVKNYRFKYQNDNMFIFYYSEDLRISGQKFVYTNTAIGGND